uniref:DDE-type integrase/transposase/recombinase n=1 Tax=Streptomyces sp. NRRL S-1824 TaxID=1463889 RepID=UPI00131E88AD
MPKPYPEEFRQDVVQVARNRGPGVTIEQVAADFGVHAMTLWKWMRRADIDDGTKPGTSSQQNAELREARRRIKLLEQENEVLRRAAAYLSQANLEKDLPARERAGRRRCSRHGDVPGSEARQAALLPLARPTGDRCRVRAGCSRERIVRRSPRGPGVRLPFLADEARSVGSGMSDRTAWRICRDNRWWSVFGKKRGRTRKAGPPVHDDLVRRDFTTDGPNRLWLTDITEHDTSEGKLYLRAIKDVFSKRIVGYSIDDRMKSRLAVAALDSAVARRDNVAGCILHSDRGSQGGFNWSSQHLDHGGVRWGETRRRCRSCLRVR